MISTSELFAGQFQLGTLLGQGGMSDVYRAVDARTGNEVALKIVRSGDPELARRVAQEVRVQQRLGHEGLITLLDTGVVGGQAYLVMELIEGATLAASLRAEPLGPRLTAKLGIIVGGALAYIHGEGIVHRDVKPSNIMLSADGRALLGDFGIARLLDATTFTIDGTTIGTIAYMAPEQLEDHQVGPAADIWSLGIVLLECLTGRRVYEGTSSEVVARRLAGPVPLPADLPVPWKLLLSGMLDHRPEQRLDGEQVASILSAPVYAEPWKPSPATTATRTVTQPLDLTALAPGVQFAPTTSTDPHTAVAPRVIPPPTVPPVFPGTQRRSRRWWPVIIAAVLVALAGAGVVYAVNRTPTTPSTHTPPAKHPTTASSTTTSTASSTTTTTTVPTAPTALAALVQDITSGEDAGTVSSGIGQALTSQAQQAVTDETQGQPQQAAQDLQQAALTIQSGEQNGGLNSSEGAILQNDLDTLAGTLGLGAAATVTTTTTTTPATSPGPGGGLLGGFGKHHGGGG